jgi:hypothetical protein
LKLERAPKSPSPQFEVRLISERSLFKGAAFKVRFILTSILLPTDKYHRIQNAYKAQKTKYSEEKAKKPASNYKRCEQGKELGAERQPPLRDHADGWLRR